MKRQDRIRKFSSYSFHTIKPTSLSFAEKRLNDGAAAAGLDNAIQHLASQHDQERKSPSDNRVRNKGGAHSAIKRFRSRFSIEWRGAKCKQSFKSQSNIHLIQIECDKQDARYLYIRNQPKSPPYVEAHDVKPGEGGQEEKVRHHSCDIPHRITQQTEKVSKPNPKNIQSSSHFTQSDAGVARIDW